MGDLRQIRNHDADLIERATLIVEEFIAQRGLVIYGGTAIDFALRTHGKHIYDDITLKYADYDFYSSDVIGDSFALGQILQSRMAIDDINIINAVHMRTLKVSIESHFVADITYCPATVLERIPTMQYTTSAGNALLVVTPHYQAIDMHSALSQPFDNPPMEVYGHRINKDITRYNILYDEFFSALRDQSQTALTDVKKQRLIYKTASPKLSSAPMIIGLAAAFTLIKIAKQHGFRPTNESALAYSVTTSADEITVDFVGPADKYSFEIFARLVPADNIAVTHHRLLDILPEKAATGGLTIYNADKFLYPAFTSGGHAFICAQGVLKQMMAKYVFMKNTFYLRVYFDVLDAMAHMENIVASPDADNAAAMRPFLTGNTIWPSATASNISMSVMYRLYLHDANLEDRKANDKEFTRARAALAARPPQLKFADKNFETHSQRFKAWVSTKRFFAVDGEPISG